MKRLRDTLRSPATDKAKVQYSKYTFKPNPAHVCKSEEVSRCLRVFTVYMCVSVCVRRRLSASARPAAEPAEHTGGGNVPVPGRRQLRHAGGHGAVAGLLQGRQPVTFLPGPAAPVLQEEEGARADRSGRRCREEAPWRVPGGAGRDRRERLQLLVLRAATRRASTCRTSSAASAPPRRR